MYIQFKLNKMKILIFDHNNVKKENNHDNSIRTFLITR